MASIHHRDGQQRTLEGEREKGRGMRGVAQEAQETHETEETEERH